MSRPIESQVRELRAATHAQDIERASEVVDTLRTTLQARSLSELLTDLEQAFANENWEVAISVIDELNQRVVTADPDEQILTEKARHLLATAVLDEEAESELRSRVELESALALEQGMLLASAGTALASKRTSTSVNETIQSVTQSTQTFQQTAETVERVADETTTPPKVIAVNPRASVPETLAAGSTKQAEITVRNIGDATASDVTVSMSAPSFLAISSETSQIGTLTGDGESTTTFSLEGTEAGSGTLDIVIETADQNGETTAVDVNVTAETKDVIDALTGTDGEVSFAELLTTIEYYNSGEPVPNTGGKQVTFQDVLIVIERYNNNQ